jgi:hypothetical protein
MTVPIFSVLGQLLPVAATPTQFYVVAIGRQTRVETITFCNQGAATTARLQVRVAGAGSSAFQYLYYDLALQPADTFVHRGPLLLFTADELWVESASGLVSFNAFGLEEFV